MRRLGGAAAAAAVLILLTGCGSQATAPTATPSVTVVSPPASPSGSPSSSASASASSSSSSSPSASASAAGSSAPAADPGRPAGQCADGDLGVDIAPAADGGAAGSQYFEVLFVNTGGSTCVLRGTPGVSVVAGSGHRQLGVPADRLQDGARDVRLASGETAAAPLRITNIRDGGGPIGSACEVGRGDDYRVYPPHSTKAFFVRSDEAYACTSSSVFMTAGPVVRYSG